MPPLRTTESLQILRLLSLSLSLDSFPFRVSEVPVSASLSLCLCLTGFLPLSARTSSRPCLSRKRARRKRMPPLRTTESLQILRLLSLSLSRFLSLQSFRSPCLCLSVSLPLSHWLSSSLSQDQQETSTEVYSSSSEDDQGQPAPKRRRRQQHPCLYLFLSLSHSVYLVGILCLSPSISLFNSPLCIYIYLCLYLCL